NSAPPAGNVPQKIYNIGNNKPVALMDFIGAIEKSAGREAIKIMTDMQPGDVYQTYADTSALERDFGYKPHTSIQEGIDQLFSWFAEHSKIL
ncbi:MAG: NAD-dependent epimerase, partial [Bacteroidales bacterium]|nr:NAD-dependent epimerase [Bacteroidales bacterium]